MLASASSAPAGTSPRSAARRMMGRAAEWSLARGDRSTAASSGSVRIAWMRPDIMARNPSVVLRGAEERNRRPFGTWVLENGAVADDLVLSLGEARRLAVRSQHLAGPTPAAGIDGMRQVLRGLRVLQLDPVNVVARSHLLVLWSRFGGFDREDLDTLLWRERWLGEC